MWVAVAANAAGDCVARNITASGARRRSRDSCAAGPCSLLPDFCEPRGSINQPAVCGYAGPEGFPLPALESGVGPDPRRTLSRSVLQATAAEPGDIFSFAGQSATLKPASQVA
ncbi:hypothetical protein D9Q98_008660 [Chlorella vulgaris]|uniref:Uncharacterized protein n=1 Tax=Chlorella vulgaris TaxID=3077 RepID=A0A9D4YUF8_CHLVU|nr:hypothetical protein D9Q98_008660 [Chlorella vulgaris]